MLSSFFIALLVPIRALSRLLRRLGFEGVMRYVGNAIISANPGLEDALRMVVEEGLDPAEQVFSSILLASLVAVAGVVISIWLSAIWQLRVLILLSSLVLSFLFIYMGIFALEIGRESYSSSVKLKLIDAMAKLETATSEEEVINILAEIPEVRTALTNALVKSRTARDAVEQAREELVEWGAGDLLPLLGFTTPEDLERVKDVVAEASLRDYATAMGEELRRVVEGVGRVTSTLANQSMMAIFASLAVVVVSSTAAASMAILLPMMLIPSALLLLALLRASKIDTRALHGESLTLGVLRRWGPVDYLVMPIAAIVLLLLPWSSPYALVMAPVIIFTAKLLSSLATTPNQGLIIPEMRRVVREYFYLRNKRRLNRLHALRRVVAEVRNPHLSRMFRKLLNLYEARRVKGIWSWIAQRFHHPALSHFLIMLEDADTMTTLDAEERRVKLLNRFERLSVQLEKEMEEKLRQVWEDLTGTGIAAVLIPAFMLPFLGAILPPLLNLFTPAAARPSGVPVLTFFILQVLLGIDVFAFVSRKLGYPTFMTVAMVGTVAAVAMLLLGIIYF